MNSRLSRLVEPMEMIRKIDITDHVCPLMLYIIVIYISTNLTNQC
jgi:hypothetical protein